MACALVLALTLRSQPAAAQPTTRLAVVAASSVGFPGEPTLRYATRDARRVAEALGDLGGIARADLALLVDTSAADLRQALADAQRRAGPTGTVIFYYSGHAGLDGLHLGTQIVPWDELRAFGDATRSGGAGLRLLFVDACHAGALARPKGFLSVPAPPTPETSRGSAVLAAAEWFDLAQESDALGGSFFTHALVSGLRGAADLDHDARVTLSELHTHIDRDVATRTAGSQTAVRQRPTYRFDVSGRGDIVLARLHDADAQVHLTPDLEGDVVILERDSSHVAVEARKPRGQPLAFALPRGRYVVHVRGPTSVGIADVTLPWGGQAVVRAGDLSARSYQEVALKGGLVDLRRIRLRAVAALDTPPLARMGLVPSLHLAAGRKTGALELVAAVGLGRRSFDAVDARVTATLVEASAVVALERPRRLLDLRTWAGGHLTRMWQTIDGAADRAGWIPALSLGGGVRIPLGARSFAEAGLEARLAFPAVQPDGRTPRAGLRAALALGWIL